MSSAFHQGDMMDARQFAAVLEKLAAMDDGRLQRVLQLLTQRHTSEHDEHHGVYGRQRGERRRLARRRLDVEFAAACGACACFGTAPHCPTCNGEGRPGWQVPDESLFRMYVAPALERLGTQRHEEPSYDAAMCI